MYLAKPSGSLDRRNPTSCQSSWPPRSTAWSPTCPDAFTNPARRLTVGGTSVNVTANVVFAAEPSALVALIVTVPLLTSSPNCDQLQVPLLFWVNVPCDVVSVTASS